VVSVGYEINWVMTGQGLVTHPLYVKYNSTSFALIDLVTVKTDLGNVMATNDNAAICAYLSWIIRTKNLIA